jgi:hypothetical protein
MTERKVKEVASNRDQPAMIRLKKMPPAIHTQVLRILDEHTYKDAEPLVQALVGFSCTTNVLCRFRKWKQAMEAMDLGQDRIRQIAAYLKEQMPDVAPDKIWELGTAFYGMTLLANDDAKGFVRVGKMSAQNERGLLRTKKFHLEERKFQESLRTKLDAGFEALSTLFDKNPEARGLLDRARKLIQPEP